MRRHAESDDVVVLADILQFDQAVELMAIKDKLSVATNCTLSSILGEVL
jgi:hypothetical protein